MIEVVIRRDCDHLAFSHRDRFTDQVGSLRGNYAHKLHTVVKRNGAAIIDSSNIFAATRKATSFFCSKSKTISETLLLRPLQSVRDVSSLVNCHGKRQLSRGSCRQDFQQNSPDCSKSWYHRSSVGRTRSPGMDGTRLFERLAE